MTTTLDVPAAEFDGQETIDIPGVPEPDEVGPVDPAAPYGRRVDGTPKAKPGRPLKARRNAAGPKVPAPPARSRAKAKSSASDPAKAYTATVAGLLQPIALALSLAGQQTNSPVLVADACAVTEATPGLSAAVGQLAADDDRIGALIDRIAKIGPYGALIGAITPLVLQVAANHGNRAVLTFAAPMGVVGPEELLERNGLLDNGSGDAQSA